MENFDIIKEARNLLRSANPGSFELSSATTEDYRLVFSRLIKGTNLQVDEIIDRAARSTHRNTWFKHSAALQYVALSTIEEKLAEQDRLQRILRITPDDSAAHSSWTTLLGQLQFYTALLNAIPKGCPIPETEREATHSK